MAEESTKAELSKAPLFERLGGATMVKAIIDDLYTRILFDERVSFFFEETDLTRLKQHQVHFLRMAFTLGPGHLDAQDLLIQKHLDLFQRKGLRAEHFDVVVEHLLNTLLDAGYCQVLIAEVLDTVLPLRAAFQAGEELYGDWSNAESSGSVHSERRLERQASEFSSLSTLRTSSLSADVEAEHDDSQRVPAVEVLVEGVYAKIRVNETVVRLSDDINKSLLRIHI